MFAKIIASEKSAIGTQTRNFGRLTMSRPPLFFPKTKLIFLCGANQAENTPSARRQELKKFIEHLSVQYRVIYAENVFNELTLLGGSKNSLDLEHEISSIADKILIILESNSAFCELGAFSHNQLRQNLIVINDAQFKSQPSFINTGPLKALEECKSPVLWYHMSSNGVIQIDGIGSTFSGIKEALETDQNQRSERVRTNISNLKPDRVSLYFIHDLIYLTEPINYSEIIEFLKIAFGEKDYSILQRLIGVLKAIDFISSTGENKDRLFRSKIGKTLMKHDFDTRQLLGAFRTHHLKTNPTRFKK